jgi:excisionase family DNA binding protein
MTDLPDFLTLDEAAAYLRVHPDTVKAAIRRKQLAGVKIGHQWRIWRKDLEAYVHGVLQAPEHN